jgi:hypothetical protein
MNEENRPGRLRSGLAREVLSGREPPPAAFVARCAAYPLLVVGTVPIGARMGNSMRASCRRTPSRAKDGDLAAWTEESLALIMGLSGRPLISQWRGC